MGLRAHVEMMCLATIRLCAEGAAALKPAATRWLAAMGEEGGAAPLWKQIRDIDAVLQLPLPEPEPSPPWLDDMLAAEAAKGGGK